MCISHPKIFRNMTQLQNQGLKENIKSFLEKGFLLSPDLRDIDEPQNIFFNEVFHSNLDNNHELLVLNKDLIDVLSKKQIQGFNWIEFEKALTLYQKQININIYTSFMDYLRKFVPSSSFEKGISKISGLKKQADDLKVVFSYTEESRKRTIQDFIGYFNTRYRLLEGMLRNRRELKQLSSISRIRLKRDREEVSMIGMVVNKSITKNKNLIIKIEDPSGSINVLVSKNKPELYTLAKDITLDETLGIVGAYGKNIVFANNILLPDIPLNRELKKLKKPAYFLVLSDLHIGSNNFLEEEFNRFIQWICGEVGNEKQKELAKSIEYIFILGDLVDGVGVYPSQNSELLINDISEQYKVCADYLKKIPDHIKIIIIPGNHDAMRIAEPQPELYRDLAAPIWELANVTLLSNPSYVNIYSSEEFPGFDILMYHGYSFIYYADVVESIRSKGGVDRGDLIMKYLLQRRHLAPTHSSNLYLPDSKFDGLVINKIPDFFLTGHLHKSVVANYRNITMICGSCWQSKTSFMEKMGLHPEPAKVPIVNLQTREVKILRFGK